jgi:hypothetical protein
MSISFLNNGGRGALKRMFEGFAQSSIAGLRGMLTFDLTNGRSPLTIFASSEDVVLSALRGAGQGAVVDPVFPAMGTPSDNKIDFVKLHAAKWMLVHRPDSLASATLRTNLATAYDILIADLRTRLSGAPDNVTTAQSDALGTAIAALGTIPGASFASPPNEARYAANVSAALVAVAGDSFRNKLLAIRPRFDRFTTVDIRGCRAGTDTAYLAAVQAFFGRSGTVRPVVTAPDLFQFFNRVIPVAPFGTTPQAAAQVLNSLHTSGVPAQSGSPAHSAASLRSQFVTWADGFGITVAHLTFWRTTFQLPALEFCRLQWPGNIPVRRVVIPRLDALPGADFADLLTRLSDIFFVRASKRPSATDLGKVTPRLGNLDTWSTQLAQPVNAADLLTHFNNYKAIYEAVEARMPGFMNSPQRIIPRTPPAGLDAQQTQAFRTALVDFIQTSANSIFAPVRIWQAEALLMTQGDAARMRYFLALGLVFQLADQTSTSLGAQRMVLYDDRRSPGTKDEAIRHWMRSAWRGVAPPTIAPDLAYELAQHSAWLVVDGHHNRGPSNVCPHPDYMAHIVVQSA